MHRRFLKKGNAWVAVSAAEYHEHRNKQRGGVGLGDAVAAVATPIARALGLSCIDPATKQLRPESKCAQRKAALNRIKLPLTTPQK